MSNDSIRSRQGTDRDEPDQWLLDAARRAGHLLADKERPAGTSAWRMLLTAGVPDDEVLRIACAASGTEPADFSKLSPTLGSVLSHSVALKHRVAPLGIRGGTLSVATSNPRNAELERELAFAARQRVCLCAASPSDVIRAQGIVYGGVYGTRGDAAPISVQPTMAPAAVQSRPAPVARLSLETTIPVEAQDDEPLVVESVPGLVVERDADVEEAAAPPAPPQKGELADRLLGTACAERASDVLLDPTPDGGILVRFRVDGTLNDRFRIPQAHSAKLVRTIKERAQLDAAAKRPQLGRMTFASANGEVALRVATEPLPNSRERVVLRLVSAHDLLDLDQLGHAPAELQRFRQLLESTSGVLIVAGPAGAGKTTTLYAAVREASAQGRAVATVEELIEYPLAGIAQTQLRGASKVTVASAVRGVLASDGDVVAIGAPLDAATLKLCAATTDRPRLVIASLDTSDLASTLDRLLKLHPDRAGLAAALGGVVVQRLVRRLCTECAAPQQVSDLPEQQQRLLDGLPSGKVRRPVGCASCRNSGFAGRTALAEVVVMTPELARGIASGVTPAELARRALRNARTTLWNSGIHRVLEGVISLAELVDTVPPPDPKASDSPQEDIDSLLTQLLGSPHMQADDAESSHADSAWTDGARTTVQRPSPVESFTLVMQPTIDLPEPVSPHPVTAALRVLLVDDDVTARRELAQALSDAGMQVLQAANGNAALAFIKRLRPDVVLTEVALPELDAIGLLAALATETSPPPVVVHTEQSDDALFAWLQEAGARAVLKRGLPLADLIERLRVETGARAS